MTPTNMNESAPAAGIGVGPEQAYAWYLAAGTWRVQRCLACGQAIFYPRIACLACGAADYAWFEPSGLGTIHSTTVMRRPPQAGGDRHLCLVDLDDGFRMMSRVDGVAPEAVAIGDRVRAFVGEDQGVPLVLFRPEGASA